MAGIPILIYGQVTESSSGVNAITIKCRNERTNDVSSGTTDSNGLFLFDLSDENNFPSGWIDGDQITVYTIYSNFEGEETITIALPLYGYQQDIELSEVSDSDLIYYTSVQSIYDELDGKTSSDISTSRIINAIQRAEAIIESKTGRFFKQETITDEVHTGDRYSLDVSPDQLDTSNIGVNMRQDNWFGNVSNRVRTKYAPIVSITSLYRNSAGPSEADSWTALTEQTGSSGDFYLENDETGVIDFLKNYPRLGKRSWKISYVAGYNRSSTSRKVISILKCVERLTILLTCKAIITTKSTGGMFDSTKSLSIGNMTLSAGSMSSSQYLRSIEPEIKELWDELGGLGIEII